ncbi:MAG: hypothetical protein QM535_02130 [Limnohabitans sp.]|nr:hypothetical protein [Limnohabitans sp.]
MKRIGVVITDGVGFRNFILSDFINESKKTFEEVIIFSCLPQSAYDGHNLDCKIIELDVFQEKFPTWFFRKAKEVAHLQLHKKNNFGIQDNLKTNFTSSKSVRGFATRFIYKLTHLFHSENFILKLNRLQQITFKSKPVTQTYSDLLSTHKVDLLFFTHQRPPYIAPLIYAAEKKKIQTATFIFSWDNLASKGRMAGNFNHYLVWSDLMKSELLHFYQSIRENQITVVGTPQFEPYVLGRYKTDKADFFKKFNFKNDLPVVYFSCGDVATSPNDQVYIDTIARAILNNKLVTEVNFVVRTSPAEEPKRFEELALKYPFIQWNFPQWIQTRSNHQESWSQRIPTVEDVLDLKALLQYSDVNINMLSTMSLDFMQFDKPVINTVFGNGTNGLANDQRFLKYAHIEKVIESKAVTLAKNEEELINAINVSLKSPMAQKKERELLIALEISKSIEGTSERLAKSLLEITG